MEKSKMHTEFAPAERASEDEIQRQRRLFQNAPLMVQMLDAVPNILVVLNRERQIVYANRNLYDALDIGEEDFDRIFGYRPGEVWKCVHAFESEGGCGTTEFCSTCGAVKAILASQSGYADIQECRIIQNLTGDALDLRVWAKPLMLNGEQFTIFAVMDISHEKRREMLERIFFHDILNTASGLKESAELIREATLGELNEFQEIIARLSNDLIEEIQAQRQLVAAENEELATHPSAFDPGAMLDEIAELYAGHEVAHRCAIHVVDEAYRGTLVTDRTLLRRVVGNMAKNALEASHPGSVVRMGCDATHDGVTFWVHNAGFIPPDVQLQIFQRSFSTKGPGRGLGTYSIKLLMERYLNGTVSFDTSLDRGTTFKVFCPSLYLEKPQQGSLADTLQKIPRTLRVLVAEDNPVNQKLITRLLERLGHTVAAVDTGKAALKALAHAPFDLVLMDCQMPEMDGFEAARAIRKSGSAHNADIPIVAMTGHAGDESREACLAAGMNDHMSKPIGREILADMLARWS